MRHLPYFHADEGSPSDKSSPGRAIEAVLPLRRPPGAPEGRARAHRGLPPLPRRRPRDRGGGAFAEELREPSGGPRARALPRPLHPSELGRSTTAPWRSSSRRSATRSSASSRSERSRSARRRSHDLGALTEVIEDSNGGLLLSNAGGAPRSHGRALLRDAELRRRLGNQGHEAWRRLWSEDAHMEVLRGDRRRPCRAAVTAVVLTYHAVEDGRRRSAWSPSSFGRSSTASWTSARKR